MLFSGGASVGIVQALACGADNKTKPLYLSL